MKRKKREVRQMWLPGMSEYDGLPYYPEPKTSAEEFCNAQKLLLEKGDRSAAGTMWTIILDITRKTLGKELKQSGYRLDGDSCHDVASEAAARIMRRYRYEGFYIKFPATVARCVVHSILCDVRERERFERNLANFFDSFPEELFQEEK
jgi:hypothetical protein